MSEHVLRLKCGKHVVTFALSQGDVVCAVADGGLVYRESWCKLEHKQLLDLIFGLRDLLNKSERAKAGEG